MDNRNEFPKRRELTAAMDEHKSIESKIEKLKDRSVVLSGKYLRKNKFKTHDFENKLNLLTNKINELLRLERIHYGKEMAE